MAELLGAPQASLSAVEQEALWLHRARGPAPTAVFVRLFMLGQSVSRSAARALWGDQLPAALAAGLLRPRARGLAATLALSLHDQVAIFADPPAAARGRAARDLVLGPTRATLVLDRALPRSPIGSALDLGTGAGLLALRLASTARRVTASDVSRRALVLARLNAQVNAALASAPRSAAGRAPGIDFVRSDRFAGLAGRRFALVVGNLPFVVAPARQYTYRDGGLGEDNFLGSVVSQVGRHLEQGGVALLLGQWIERAGQPEEERLAPWLVAAGCDAVIYRLDSEPPDVYAARWSAGPRPDLPRPARLRALAGWSAHLGRLGVQQVHTGLFALRRRRTGRHFFLLEDLPPAAPTPDWESIRRRLYRP